MKIEIFKRDLSLDPDVTGLMEEVNRFLEKVECLNIQVSCAGTIFLITIQHGGAVHFDKEMD